MFSTAEAKYTWVSYTNTKNNDLWIQVKRIMQLTEEIVTVLDPNVVIALQEKNNEIKVSCFLFMSKQALRISINFNILFMSD